MDENTHPTEEGYFCHTCGKWHDSLPLDVGCDEPVYVEMLSPEERRDRVTVDGDFRVVRHPEEETHYFVRGVIEIPVHGLDDAFCYGVWVSLSEQSYRAARDAYRRDVPAGPFFGWLCNALPGYPETLSLKTHVMFRSELRPTIALEPTDHPLAVEQRNGITRERVQEIVATLLH